MIRRTLYCMGALLVFCVANAGAQWPDPFARLEHGVTPGCPFECDSVTAWVEGELTSTNWTVPEVTGWVRDGDQIIIDYYTQYQSVGLPVLIPFRVDVPLGPLPEGRYEILHQFSLENPISTMPIVPVVMAADTVRVAPPGDQNCNGFVDVLDLLQLIEQVFLNGPAPDPAYRADIDCDGFINLGDIVNLVFHIFAGRDICDPCDGTSMLPSVHITDLPPSVLRDDPFVLQDVSIVEDTLTVVLSRSGGCKEHAYTVFMSPAAFMESAPVQANLYLRHSDPNDPCDAWITEDYRVNLRPLAELYQLQYQSLDEIILNVFDYEGDVSVPVTYRPE